MLLQKAVVVTFRLTPPPLVFNGSQLCHGLSPSLSVKLKMLMPSFYAEMIPSKRIRRSSFEPTLPGYIGAL